MSETYIGFGAGELDPVLACEETACGWRALVATGEILNVEAKNGAPRPSLPTGDTIDVVAGRRYLGTRKLPDKRNTDEIEPYLFHCTRATSLFQQNEFEAALVEIDKARSIAATVSTKFTRAHILLSLGRWLEGFADYAECERTSQLFMRPRYREAIDRGLVPWRGEDIYDKRLLLVHDHGFGDTIQMLRYVPQLGEMGAEVILLMPQELARLTRQCAPVVDELIDCDYFCPMLQLMHVLEQTPQNVPSASYLAVEPHLVEKWRHRLNARKHIGIAWSVGYKIEGDYPRAIPRALLEELASEGELIAVQQDGSFEDFADAAALMSLCDEIVTVDTAAAHLAGAIGHRKVSLLLSHWHSWRWQVPLYPGVQIYRQDAPNDWASALRARKGQSTRATALPIFPQGALAVAPINWDGLPREYLGEGELELIIALIRSVANARVMMEIGLAEGRTAKAILRELPQIEHYIGVDTDADYRTKLENQWSERGSNPGHLALDDARFERWLLPQGSFDLSADELPDVDIVFIDGDHSAEAVRHDSDLARQIVRPGGLIIWHDAGNENVEVRKVLELDHLRGHPIFHIAGTWLAFERIGA